MSEILDLYNVISSRKIYNSFGACSAQPRGWTKKQWTKNRKSENGKTHRRVIDSSYDISGYVMFKEESTILKKNMNRVVQYIF